MLLKMSKEAQTTDLERPTKTATKTKQNNIQKRGFERYKPNKTITAQNVYMIEREKLKNGVLTKKKSDKRNAAASVDVVDQSLSCIQLFATPWIVAWQAPLDIGVSQARTLEWVVLFLQWILLTQESSLCLLHCRQILYHCDFPGGSDGKQLACNAGDPGSISGLGRSCAEGYGNPFQYSCLENSINRGEWRDTVYRVTKSQT